MEELNVEDYQSCLLLSEKIQAFKENVAKSTQEHLEGVKDDGLPIVTENATHLSECAENSFCPALVSFKECMDEIAAGIKEGIERVGGEV